MAGCKATFVSSLLLLLPAMLAAQFPVPPAPSDVAPVASYDMDVRLDPEEHTASGSEVVTWNSPATVPVDRLLFHLYLNAFSHEETTWFRRANPPEDDHPIRPEDWGYIEIHKVELLGEEGEAVADLTEGISYIQTDDDNTLDRTVMQVALPEAVPAGGTARIRIEFTSRLPRFRARTGYFDGFHFFAQWFPKLAVWEPEGMRGRSPGGWNAHQFQAFTEFYADYGSYDVRLTVPDGWTVGATGRLQGDPERAGGAETHHYRQDGVHDFTWLASPLLQSETRTFDIADMRDKREARWLEEKVGVAAADLELPPVEVRLLYPAEHAHLVDRQFQAVFRSILYFGYWFGPFPYETLTVLDPPHNGEGAGGMEYPTLITGGSGYWSPSDRLSPEGVLVHEFGHQYWYGLVGSNEFEEAWLDEGLNTYSTGRVLSKAYGPDMRYSFFSHIPVPGMALVDSAPKFPGWRSGDTAGILTGILNLRPFGVPRHPLLDLFREVPWIGYVPEVAVPHPYGRRQRFLTDPAAEPIANESWRIEHRNVLRVNAYDRPATTLWTLERLVGSDSMIRAMRTYHLKYRYRHPSAFDFARTFNEASGRDMQWFFDAFIFGNETVDFAVERVDQREVKEPLGVFFEGGERVLREPEEGDEGDDGNTVWKSRVHIRRNGTVPAPVSVLVIREGEPPIREEWNGRDNFTVLEYQGGKVTRVVVDPDHQWLLDLDRSNNIWNEKTDPEPALRWSERVLLWMQNMLLFYGSLT